MVLKGTVDPANANVRVKGQSVEVRHGRWKLPVTLTKHGEINVFVGGRYLVEIDSHDLPPAALRKAAGALDLAKLAALK